MHTVNLKFGPGDKVWAIRSLYETLEEVCESCGHRKESHQTTQRVER